MANFKTGWVKKLVNGVSEKIFAIAHVKTVYYDYANKKTLSDKLDEIDKKIDESVTKDAVTNALGYTPYTPNEIDNKFSTLETNIDWKEAVATFSDIATTYPNPEDGWTVNVKDTDYTYRYNGSKWVAISANAIPKATSSVDGLMSSTDKSKLDGIAANANNYSLPTATSSVLGGVKVGSNITLSGDVISLSKTNVTSALGYTPPTANTDTKNTAGSTDTSSKIFLVGATSQAANPQTYSHDTAYVGTDGCVYSGGKKTSVEGHTHNYAGSSSAGGAATSANKLNTNAGSATNPIYFADGIPKACSYSLNKTVPSNALFTDTNTWRGIQNNLTSTSTTDSLSAYQGKLLNDKINSLCNGMGSVYITSTQSVSNDGAIISKSLSKGTYLIIIWLSNDSTGGGWFGNDGAIVTDTSSAMYGAIPAGGCIMKVHTIGSSPQTVGLWNGNGKTISVGAGTCLFYMKTF